VPKPPSSRGPRRPGGRPPRPSGRTTPPQSERGEARGQQRHTASDRGAQERPARAGGRNAASERSASPFQRDRSERNERPQRAARRGSATPRSERPDRGERPVRLNRDTAGPPTRGPSRDRDERQERPQRSARPGARGAAPDRGTGPDRSERPARPNRDKAASPAWGASRDRAERQERPQRPARPGSRGPSPERGDRPDRGDRPARPTRDRAGPPRGPSLDRAERPARGKPHAAAPRGDKPVRPRAGPPPRHVRTPAAAERPAPTPKPAFAPDRVERQFGPREPQRIAKLLARAGIASRREIERMIEERRIAIDNVPLETPATIVTSLQGITVDGKPVRPPAATRLFLYHKPTGLITAERDPAGRPTIYDKLPEGLPRLMPVGRLDLNTEGLLLLTNDGEFKRKLELPSTGVERTYRARVFGDVSQEQLEELIHGIEIEGIRYGAIDANLERRTGRNGWVEMRLKEGKNREVRRVLEHLGLQVSRLIRVAYGPFVLADLPMGEIGEVRQHELVEFRKSL
jgi:23S rRNA pseudouridine2605 synthase